MRLRPLAALSGAALMFAAPAALAQPAEGPALRYDTAPWWMREAVIPSLGRVEVRSPANRAGFSASFQTIDRDLGKATRATAAKVRALGEQLASYGVEKVEVQITFQTTPLYEQYRDRQGNVQENQRADQIDRYQVDARVTVMVRDVTLLERIYATVLAAGPASTQPVYFSLEPTNEMKSEIARRAIEDAARRAREAVAATGARLGAVRLIDPTARACSTDVLLAGAPQDGPDVSESATVSAYARAPSAPPPPPPPPPAPGGGNPAEFAVPLQPPTVGLQEDACVVFQVLP